MNEKEQSEDNEKNRSNGILAVLAIWFHEHFHPTAPEEQLPSLTGLRSGWTFRFKKEGDSFSGLLYILVLLLVLGCLISAVFS